MSRYGRSQEQVNAIAHQHKPDWQTATAGQTEFFLKRTVLNSDNLLVYVEGLLKRPADSSSARDYRIRGIHKDTPASATAYPGDSNAVLFTSGLSNGDAVCFLTAGG